MQIYLSDNVSRSAPINVEDIGTVHFRVKNPIDGQVHLMTADIKLGGSTIFIVLSRAGDAWPFSIENDSDYNFTFYQTVGPTVSGILEITLNHVQDSDHPDASDTNRTGTAYHVESKKTVNYAWDFPAARDKRILLRVNDSRRAIDLMEIGDLVPFKFAVCAFLSSRVVAASSLRIRVETALE